MNMVWDRFVSTRIRELGYDIGTHTLAVVFADGTKNFHSPVPYDLYAAVRHAKFPERLYWQTINGNVPQVRG